MDNNPIDIMLEEHELISSSEEIIQHLDKKWETDKESYKNSVRELITFFREYADGVHHRKEEEVLFPALRECNDFTLEELLDELENHHEDFRDYSKEIEEALDEENFEKSQQNLNEYLNDLLDHIGAENDELFVLAETLLDEDELEKIYFRFKDIEMEIGEAEIEELKNLVRKM